MRRLLRYVILLLLAGSLSAQGQQGKSLLAPDLRDLLHEALSGELAKDHVIQITRNHRIQGSRGYRDGANYVLKQLRAHGFSAQDAYIESFPSDGRATYQTWQSPSGWAIDSAELRMLEPYEERIVGYPEIAMSVITYSNTGDETAQLVWVGRGTQDADYTGKDVKGKFVLATGYGGGVHRLAVLKYGAKAVVCYLDDDRAREYPDMLAYTGMWPRSEELDDVTFGFNLTNRQGEKLKQLLAAGQRVVLRGQVSGIGLEPYAMDVVVAHIRGAGKADEELVFSAHLDHPKESANDNASGSAAILDIATSLNGLVEGGRLPRPQRSIRFIWIPEWYGTMAYIDAHPEVVGPRLGGKYLANLNMDMVGEDLERLHSKLVLTRTPDSMPSVLNDVVANMAAMVDGMDIRTPRGSLSAFNYRITPYSGGSDHMMFIERGIPGVMFSHSPDYTHHTSEDTPDKVDPVELERCEVIAAGTMLFLANLTAKEGVDLTYLAGGNAMARMGEAGRAAHQMLTQVASNGTAADAPGDAHNLLERTLEREMAAIKSVLSFNQDRAIRITVDAMVEQLRGHYELLSEHLREGFSEGGDTANKTDNRIPIRLTRGPLDFGLPESKLSDSDVAWYRSRAFGLSGNQRFELVNFIDGDRTVTDIRNALSAEFETVSTDVVSRFISDLVKVGVISWKK